MKGTLKNIHSFWVVEYVDKDNIDSILFVNPDDAVNCNNSFDIDGIEVNFLFGETDKPMPFKSLHKSRAVANLIYNGTCDECKNTFIEEPNTIGNSEEPIIMCNKCYDENYGEDLIFKNIFNKKPIHKNQKPTTPGWYWALVQGQWEPVSVFFDREDGKGMYVMLIGEDKVYNEYDGDEFPDFDGVITEFGEEIKK